MLRVLKAPFVYFSYSNPSEYNLIAVTPSLNELYAIPSYVLATSYALVDRSRRISRRTTSFGCKEEENMILATHLP